MPTITAKGQALREELNRELRLAGVHIGREHDETLSMLSRRAKRYATRKVHELNEPWANGEKWDDDNRRLEMLIHYGSQSLPGVVGACFQDDPRGFCVRLVLANGHSNCLDGQGWGIA